MRALALKFARYPLLLELAAALVLAALIIFPQVAKSEETTTWRAGDFMEVRTVCPTPAPIATAIKLWQEGKAQEGNEVLLQAIESGLCLYREEGFAAIYMGPVAEEVALPGDLYVQLTRVKSTTADSYGYIALQTRVNLENAPHA